MQIHRADPVIIGSITTGLAGKHMRLFVSVQVVRMPTFRTGLAGVFRIDRDRFAAVQLGLILYFPAQIVERPAYLFIAILQCYTLGSRANPSKIL